MLLTPAQGSECHARRLPEVLASKQAEYCCSPQLRGLSALLECRHTSLLPNRPRSRGCSVPLTSVCCCHYQLECCGHATSARVKSVALPAAPRIPILLCAHPCMCGRHAAAPRMPILLCAHPCMCGRHAAGVVPVSSFARFMVGLHLDMFNEALIMAITEPVSVHFVAGSYVSTVLLRGLQGAPAWLYGAPAWVHGAPA